MIINLRFFSFPEVMTDTVSLTLPGYSSDFSELMPGQTYYLAKDRYTESALGKIQRDRSDSLRDPDLLSVSFEVDPGKSLVKGEHVSLAHYLKDHYLSIDVFDAESKFHYASCKLPLYELLRQQKS